MKIDFLGRYGDIEKLLAVPEPKEKEGLSAAPSFSSLMSPETSEAPESTRNSAPPHPPRPLPSAPPNDIMASFKFPEPTLFGPPTEVQFPPEPAVNQTSPPVKAPSLLEVRRIPAETGIAALPREERVETIGRLVAGAGSKYGVDPALGMAIVEVESSFNPKAISGDGHATKGLFQLKDSTGKSLLKGQGSDRRYDPMDPGLNVDLGVNYLRYLHDIFSAKTALHERSATVGAANSASLEKLAVAAFNAGEGRVAEAQRRASRAGKDPSLYEQVSEYLPESTQNYVRKVMASKETFGGHSIG